MISSYTCVYCAQARAWFAEHSVPFSECSIERDTACAARFAALLSPGTPVLLVRGRPQVGFSPQRVAEALRRS
jgi:arsenate reductase-like glutaredoxin family protein